MARLKKPKAPRVDPIPPNATILQWLELSVEELTRVVRENPSLRGMIVGYVAEFQLRKVFAADPRVSELTKDDDHDRTAKGDLRFVYRGHIFKVESKSLQTNSTKKLDDGSFDCLYQCDASDARPVVFKDESEVTTTSLLVGEFDMLAVCMFAAANSWQFLFAKNRELPRSTSSAYTPLQRNELLSTSMRLRWPLAPGTIYSSSAFEVLDSLVLEREQAASLQKP